MRREMLKDRVARETRLVSDLPLVRSDRVQLQQVIMNPVINAIEVISKSGRIVTAAADYHKRAPRRQCGGNSPRLWSSSEARTHSTIFEAFYSTKPSGMGIALSICRSIVEAHDGRIWADRNTDRDATPHVDLPSPSNNRSSATAAVITDTLHAVNQL
jgi:signal transduction histidine kinase